MFSHLRKKIQPNELSIAPSPSLPEKTPGRVSSVESLESGGGQSETRSRRKDELVKRMESKLLEMANMLRDKNEQLEDITRRHQQEREESDKVMLQLTTCSVTEPMFILEQYRQEMQRRSKNPDISSQEKEWLESCFQRVEESVSAFRNKHGIFEEQNATLAPGNISLVQFKSLLMSGEAQLQHCQRNVFSSQTELDAVRQQLEQVKRDRDMQLKWHESAQIERDQFETENRRWQSALRDLQVENADFRKEIEELNEQVAEKDRLLRSAECLCSETQDRLQSLQRDYETTKHRLAQQQEMSTDREAALQERLNTLQTRLAILEHNEKEEENLMNGSGESGTAAGADLGQLKTLQKRMALLSEERSHLEESLQQLRTHSNESKVKWMDRVNALESQIANLNSKLSEDTQELQQELQGKQQALTKLERQLQEAKVQWREAEERVAQCETQNVDLQRQCKRWQARCELLETEKNSHADSLREQLEQLTAERAVDRKSQEEYQITVETQNARIHELTNKLTSLNRELILAKEELSEKSNRVNQLEKERFEQNLRLSECKSQIHSSSEECTRLRASSAGMQDDIASTKADLRRSEEVRAFLDAKVKELESHLESERKSSEQRMKCLQDEAEGKAAEVKNLRSEVVALTGKLEEMESEKETVLVRYESNELSRLKEELADMQIQLSDKNKTIKIQKQRLQELKKTLERELRMQSVPASMMQGGAHCPPALITAQSATGGVKNGSVPQAEPSMEKCADPLESSSTPTPVSPLSQSSPCMAPGDPSPQMDGKGSVVMSAISYRYLRHVVIKFLVCKESEAVHLVRALATLLKLSLEEEELLRQTLEYRRSWFATRPSLPSSHHSTTSPLSSTSTR